MRLGVPKDLDWSSGSHSSLQRLFQLRKAKKVFLRFTRAVYGRPGGAPKVEDESDWNELGLGGQEVSGQIVSEDQDHSDLSWRFLKGYGATLKNNPTTALQVMNDYFAGILNMSARSEHINEVRVVVDSRTPENADGKGYMERDPDTKDAYVYLNPQAAEKAGDDVLGAAIHEFPHIVGKAFYGDAQVVEWYEKNLTAAQRKQALAHYVFKDERAHQDESELELWAQNLTRNPQQQQAAIKESRDTVAKLVGAYSAPDRTTAMRSLSKWFGKPSRGDIKARGAPASSKSSTV